MDAALGTVRRGDTEKSTNILQAIDNSLLAIVDDVLVRAQHIVQVIIDYCLGLVALLVVVDFK